VSAERLKRETMLLLGTGHCFRDHVLEVCPEFARFASDADGIRKSFEGSSLETIKHMVAAGMGVTLVPRLSVPEGQLQEIPIAPKKRATKQAGTPAMSQKTAKNAVLSAPAASGELLRYLPLAPDGNAPAPTRRVVLAWRRSFTRYEAIAALRNSIYACALPGVTRLT
jgi:LysR family transcriptional regulator, hydrogen peroxide-inducible genes activator